MPLFYRPHITLVQRIMNSPMRLARKPHVCRFCDRLIKEREKYLDGGKKLKSHLDCLEQAKEMAIG